MNKYGVKEKYYAEVSVRDARRALTRIYDEPVFRESLRKKELKLYGSNIFATNDEDMFDDICSALYEQKIEFKDSRDINEISSTGSVEGYATPYAFGDAKPSTYNQNGLTKAKKTNKFFKPMNESLYKKMMSETHDINTINEAISYRDYKRDDASTPAQKVNKGIYEMNKMLAEIEKIMHMNLRLKNEMGVDSSQFWKQTNKRINKINERIIRISNKLKELSK